MALPDVTTGRNHVRRAGGRYRRTGMVGRASTVLPAAGSTPQPEERPLTAATATDCWAGGSCIPTVPSAARFVPTCVVFENWSGDRCAVCGFSPAAGSQPTSEFNGLTKRPLSDRATYPSIEQPVTYDKALQLPEVAHLTNLARRWLGGSDGTGT